MPGGGDFRHGLPSLQTLLTSGGDERIAPDPRSGRNRYGLDIFADRAVLALGATTASPMTEAGLAAATALHARLNAALARKTLEQLVAEETARLKAEIVALYLGDFLPSASLDVVLAASGSDAHRLALHRLAARGPLKVITVEATETGSQIEHILAQTPRAAVHAVVLRNGAVGPGSPRPPEEVEAEVEAQVRRAFERGERVLLIVADLSKTGLLAPGLETVMRLRQQYGDSLDVLVDACQLRLSATTIRAYLAQGFMLALTGSKFMAGPPFSAALLLPESGSMPPDEETSRVDFSCLGLLLRWEAALAHTRPFVALPEEKVGQVIDAFAHAVEVWMAQEPRLQLLPTPAPDRCALRRVSARDARWDANWDERPTIFTFLLRPSPNASWLGVDAVTAIYHALLRPEDPQVLCCQFGQPVVCRNPEGEPWGSLRLSLSAPLILEAAANESSAERVNARVCAALDRVVCCLPA